MLNRRRFKRAQSLAERLLHEARSARERASSLPPGRERDDLLRQARNADIAAHIDEWLKSPGLQPPD
ncbi:hypothetical protein QA640_21105 [Bradyrhizobium sp. CB82]|uniref:hypothetical protein n=1 Tax=Bradyrhizobium sp. CB82 TaxID=3039159 RepID=UPI0024B0878C|nr:hypothetical protein [Bradyrhizobium sp. CB82]WFU44730.1 hypothetical protein QA640_21105 [Bradyrhizobium sp. CB82]